MFNGRGLISKHLLERTSCTDYISQITDHTYVIHAMLCHPFPLIWSIIRWLSSLKLKVKLILFHKSFRHILFCTHRIDFTSYIIGFIFGLFFVNSSALATCETGQFLAYALRYRVASYRIKCASCNSRDLKLSKSDFGDWSVNVEAACCWICCTSLRLYTTQLCCSFNHRPVHNDALNHLRLFYIVITQFVLLCQDDMRSNIREPVC